jgi:tetratricopeptide (TPR) repeat protein
MERESRLVTICGLMSKTTDIHPKWDSFNSLPIRPNETWQGIVALCPQVVLGKTRGEVVRPRGVFWCHASGVPAISLELFDDDPATQWPLVLAAKLCDGAMSKGVRYRPARVEVRDVAQAQLIRENAPGVEVVVRDELPGIELLLNDMAKEFEPGAPPHESLLFELPMEELLDFVEAAKAFFEAAPWAQLTSDDLITVVSPKAPNSSFSHVVVMGNAGKSFGLRFFDNVASFQAMFSRPFGASSPPPTKAIALNFDPPADVPFRDARRFDELDLPLATHKGQAMVPTFTWLVGKKLQEVPANVYPFVTALLRAITKTNEVQIDSGRWSIDVASVNGPTTVELEMPELLEQMTGKHKAGPKPITDRRQMDRMMRDLGKLMQSQNFKGEADARKFMDSVVKDGLVPQSVPTNDHERAQQLADEAAEARGHRRIQLARQAIAIDPDCCDALTMIAEYRADSDTAVEAWQNVVDAGARALGEDAFKNMVGHFWGVVETRPYMRARHHLANALLKSGRIEEAAKHMQEMLALSEGDNLGVRDELAPVLAELGKWSELDALLKRYNDPMTASLWARAMCDFGMHGVSRDSDQALARAIRSNPGLAFLLHSKEAIKDESQGYSPGSEEEAHMCANLWARFYDKTPDVQQWLDDVLWKIKNGRINLSSPTKGKGGKPGKPKKPK